jgi:hypothetical protein
MEGRGEQGGIEGRRRKKREQGVGDREAEGQRDHILGV